MVNYFLLLVLSLFSSINILAMDSVVELKEPITVFGNKYTYYCPDLNILGPSFDVAEQLSSSLQRIETDGGPMGQALVKLVRQDIQDGLIILADQNDAGLVWEPAKPSKGPTGRNAAGSVDFVTQMAGRNFNVSYTGLNKQIKSNGHFIRIGLEKIPTSEITLKENLAYQCAQHFQKRLSGSNNADMMHVLPQNDFFDSLFFQYEKDLEDLNAKKLSYPNKMPRPTKSKAARPISYNNNGDASIAATLISTEILMPGTLETYYPRCARVIKNSCEHYLKTLPPSGQIGSRPEILLSSLHTNRHAQDNIGSANNNTRIHPNILHLKEPLHFHGKDFPYFYHKDGLNIFGEQPSDCLALSEKIKVLEGKGEIAKRLVDVAKTRCQNKSLFFIAHNKAHVLGAPDSAAGYWMRENGTGIIEIPLYIDPNTPNIGIKISHELVHVLIDNLNTKYLGHHLGNRYCPMVGVDSMLQMEFKLAYEKARIEHLKNPHAEGTPAFRVHNYLSRAFLMPELYDKEMVMAERFTHLLQFEALFPGIIKKTWGDNLYNSIIAILDSKKNVPQISFVAAANRNTNYPLSLLQDPKVEVEVGPFVDDKLKEMRVLSKAPDGTPVYSPVSKTAAKLLDEFPKSRVPKSLAFLGDKIEKILNSKMVRLGKHFLGPLGYISAVSYHYNPDNEHAFQEAFEKGTLTFSFRLARLKLFVEILGPQVGTLAEITLGTAADIAGVDPSLDKSFEEVRAEAKLIQDELDLQYGSRMCSPPYLEHMVAAHFLGKCLRYLSEEFAKGFKKDKKSTESKTDYPKEYELSRLNLSDEDRDYLEKALAFNPEQASAKAQEKPNLLPQISTMPLTTLLMMNGLNELDAENQETLQELNSALELILPSLISEQLEKESNGEKDNQEQKASKQVAPISIVLPSAKKEAPKFEDLASIENIQLGVVLGAPALVLYLKSGAKIALGLNSSGVTLSLSAPLSTGFWTAMGTGMLYAAPVAAVLLTIHCIEKQQKNVKDHIKKYDNRLKNNENDFGAGINGFNDILSGFESGEISRDDFINKTNEFLARINHNAKEARRGHDYVLRHSSNAAISDKAQPLASNYLGEQRRWLQVALDVNAIKDKALLFNDIPKSTLDRIASMSLNQLIDEVKDMSSRKIVSKEEYALFQLLRGEIYKKGQVSDGTSYMNAWGLESLTNISAPTYLEPKALVAPKEVKKGDVKGNSDRSQSARIKRVNNWAKALDNAWTNLCNISSRSHTQEEFDEAKKTLKNLLSQAYFSPDDNHANLTDSPNINFYEYGLNNLFHPWVSDINEELFKLSCSEDNARRRNNEKIICKDDLHILKLNNDLDNLRKNEEILDDKKADEKAKSEALFNIMMTYGSFKENPLVIGSNEFKGIIAHYDSLIKEFTTYEDAPWFPQYEKRRSLENIIEKRNEILAVLNSQDLNITDDKKQEALNDLKDNALNFKELLTLFNIEQLKLIFGDDFTEEKKQELINQQTGILNRFENCGGNFIKWHSFEVAQNRLTVANNRLNECQKNISSKDTEIEKQKEAKEAFLEHFNLSGEILKIVDQLSDDELQELFVNNFSHNSGQNLRQLISEYHKNFRYYFKAFSGEPKVYNDWIDLCQSWKNWREMNEKNDEALKHKNWIAQSWADIPAQGLLHPKQQESHDLAKRILDSNLCKDEKILKDCHNVLTQSYKSIATHPAIQRMLNFIQFWLNDSQYYSTKNRGLYNWRGLYTVAAQKTANLLQLVDLAAPSLLPQFAASVYGYAKATNEHEKKAAINAIPSLPESLRLILPNFAGKRSFNKIGRELLRQGHLALTAARGLNCAVALVSEKKSKEYEKEYLAPACTVLNMCGQAFNVAHSANMIGRNIYKGTLISKSAKIFDNILPLAFSFSNFLRTAIEEPENEEERAAWGISDELWKGLKDLFSYYVGNWDGTLDESALSHFCKSSASFGLCTATLPMLPPNPTSALSWMYSASRWSSGLFYGKHYDDALLNIMLNLSFNIKKLNKLRKNNQDISEQKRLIQAINNSYNNLNYYCKDWLGYNSPIYSSDNKVRQQAKMLNFEKLLKDLEHENKLEEFLSLAEIDFHKKIFTHLNLNVFEGLNLLKYIYDTISKKIISGELVLNKDDKDKLIGTKENLLVLKNYLLKQLENIPTPTDIDAKKKFKEKQIIQKQTVEILFAKLLENLDGDLVMKKISGSLGLAYFLQQAQNFGLSQNK